MTKLQFINICVQIFFIRIVKRLDNGTFDCYGLMYFVLPFTGCYNNYVFLNGLKYKWFK